ncbi:unnamed protein product [Linum tenue]|uniref:TLC domain-containing protein n=1 Tax=Linum tenue TaxID=586396 RepID=A0AAV0LNE6_9ROSI|nr:unnamed protein product [Linum tenue]
MENQILSIVAGGVACWTAAFILARNMFPKRSLEFCNRLVSTLHAILGVTLASLTVADWRRPVSPVAADSSPRQCGTEMVAALWVTEISSPFLHLRELLKELGYRDTQFNFAADIAFAAIFSFARMGCGPYLTYVVLAANNPLIIKAMGLGLQLVSAFWFYKIVRMVRYKVTKWTSTSTSATKKAI